jgi:hypothetical protein
MPCSKGSCRELRKKCLTLRRYRRRGGRSRPYGKIEKFYWNSFCFHDNYISWVKEGTLPKHRGAYKSEKRRKELTRQKKQEERRQRKLSKGDNPPSDAEKVEQEENQPANP